MKTRALFFTSPGKIKIQEIELPPAPRGQVLVRSIYSGISAGTELLFFRGLFPKKMTADSTLNALQHELKYPLQYGYTTVGEVVEVENSAERHWLGKQVFAFHPHQEMFWENPENLFPLPGGMPTEKAVFFPNLETAVNLAMDAGPYLGEIAVLFGAGVVGQLTGMLLSQFPLQKLYWVEPRADRRRLAELTLQNLKNSGPVPESGIILTESFGPENERGDVAIEASGNPAAVQAAIDSVGFGGRVILAGWYGEKAIPLNLGGQFHRDRINIISSQVSTIRPELSGRWSKTRRFQLVWQWLKRLPVEPMITHYLPFEQAERAFEQLDAGREGILQVVLKY